MKAILVSTPGGPEQLVYADKEIPKPGKGQALVKLGAAGVNFIDVYHRTGLYPQALPFTPGMEGAGTVVEVGEGHSEVAPGQRVAYAMEIGSYAEYALVPVWKLVPVPAALSDSQAAALMLQGMTAHYLAYSTFDLQAGQTCVIHAAGGGVGLLLTQIAKQKGATVIGTTSAQPGSEKHTRVREAGADFVCGYDEFEARTKELTDGKGAEVVYDSVGATTFEASLNCLRPRGMMVTYGNASGPVPDMSPLKLSAKGSLFLTRPTLAHYAATRNELLWRSGDLMEWLAAGKLKLRIEREYPLAEAAAAHRALEGRGTSGKLVLLP